MIPEPATPTVSGNLAPATILLAGPTGVGKSEVALLLAEKLGGEIISVDSMQVYRGLDIGTAKPSLEERSRVAHHLIDVAELTEPFDAAKFAALAKQAHAEILARGRVAILCGGTGLYFNAWLEGLGESPPADPVLRASFEERSLPDLLRELAERDPLTYAEIDRQNPRRVIRALEVIRLTGKSFSTQKADWTMGKEGLPLAVRGFGLVRSPEDLHSRIDARVDEMFRRGLVAETQQLLQSGLAGNLTASQALGYKQVIEYLRGDRSLPETIKLVKTRTRRYAKRQMTWFRRQMDLNWLHLQAQSRPEDIAQAIAQWGQNNLSLLSSSR